MNGHGTGNGHGPGSSACNNPLYSGPGHYSASISKASGNECEGETEDGIRVVREVRMSFGSTAPSTNDPVLRPEHSFEMAGGDNGNGSAENTTTRNGSVESDLGDFEFPDYKGRLNAASC